MKTLQAGKYLLIMASLLVISCSQSIKTDKSLNGKSIEFIKEKIGNPTTYKEFVLTKSLYEYQYGLLVYYPEPDGKNIHIMEYVWDKEHKNTVVWFHLIKNKWVSLDNLTWNPDKVKF
jgi:hypothetical protein